MLPPPPDPMYIRPHPLAGANPSHFTPLPSATRAHLQRFAAFSAMAGSGSDSDQSGSVDWGVIPCGLEEAMAVRIALRRSREDSARPTDGSVRRDAIASAHRALGSSGAGSSRSRPEHLSFPITGRAEYESHRERAARRGKERIRAAEARIAAEMAAAEAADAAARAAAEEEAIRARIVKKRQRRNTRALAREQNRAVRAMAGLPPKEEKGRFDDKQIRLDPDRVFDPYFREKDTDTSPTYL